MPPDMWEIISSVAAALSAVFAAIAAGVSWSQARDFRSQVQRDRNAEKRARAFDYSSSGSGSFVEARQLLGASFGGMFDGHVVDVNAAEMLFLKDRKTLDAFNYVLNHYGRAAAAIHYDVIDADVAENLLKLGFVAFWSKYEAYLLAQFESNALLKEQYRLSAELYKSWRTEASKT